MKRNLIILAVIIALCLCGCGKEDLIKDNLTLGEESIYAAPDYEYQLYLSDDIILGEVVGELDGYYTDPEKNTDVVDAWIVPYVVRVNESYRGVLSKGDEVVVSTWHNNKPGDNSNIYSSEGDRDFYLYEGQRAVFMLYDCSEYLPIDGWDKVYEVTYQNEGLFEPKETGTANMGEEAKEIYASPSFEITLDQIPDDIKKADEKFADVNLEESVF